MKKQLLCAFLCILTLQFAGCKKEDMATGNTRYEPAKRPAGERIGNAEKYTFGSSATSISSKNGEIRIDIPAQTIDGTNSLTLQKIKNTSPGGIGDAYRISFDKVMEQPVTVKFSYESRLDSLSGDPECTTGVSLQDSVSGFWALQTQVVFNAVGNYVSFNTSAQKFDLAFVQPISLTPTNKTVRPLTDVKFSVLSNLPTLGPLCSLYGSEVTQIFLCDDVLAERAIIDRWEVLTSGKGAGTLEPNGPRAVYKTSAYELPDINPATILVFLKTFRRPLSAKVYVEPEVSGLKFKVGNQQYSFSDDMIDAGILSNGMLGMSWDHTTHSGSLTCRSAKPGTYNWSQDTGFLFEPGDMSPPQAFQHLYNDGLIISAGEIKITQSGMVGQRMVGSFEITNAGSTNLETSEYIGHRKITGTFNVMRDF